MAFTLDEEKALKKVALKGKLQTELKILHTQRDTLYADKELDMETEKLKAEQLVNDNHMPDINLKDSEINDKQTEITNLDIAD